MPLRLKLWKRSQQYNVSDHWIPESRVHDHPLPSQVAPSLPLVISECQSEIPAVSCPPVAGMSSHTANNNSKSTSSLVMSADPDGDPIYVNARACTLASSSQLSSRSSHFNADEASINRLNHMCVDRSWSSDPDRLSLDDRRRLLPPYLEPPDYETYVRRKYFNHGSPV